jgi:hypothetical protein
MNQADEWKRLTEDSCDCKAGFDKLDLGWMGIMIRCKKCNWQAILRTPS